MNYAKEQTRDTAYVSVNTLIQSKKSKALSALPTYAQFQKEQEPPESSPKEGEVSETTSDKETVPADQPMEKSEAGDSPGQVASAAESETAVESAPESSEPEVTQQTGTPESGLSKDTALEVDEAELEKGEKTAVQAEQGSNVIQKKSMAAEGGDGPGEDPLKGLRGGGEALPENIQTKMEPALGMDLGNVRLHQDPSSAAVAEAMGARAFTSKQDIYFNQGEYNPDTSTGNHLLAHELTHVKQQQTLPGLQYQLQETAGRDRYEKEADAMADRVVNSPGQAANQTKGTPLSKSNAGGSVQLAAKPESQGNTGLSGILKPVAGMIRQIPGYDLLTLVIGSDPLSGQAVKRDSVTVVKAIMGIIPGGAALFDSLEQAKVITKASNWFQGEFQKLNITWNTITGQFRKAGDVLSPLDLLNLGRAFEKVKQIFLAPVSRITNFVRQAGPKLMEFIFEGALSLAGSAGQKIMGILNQGKGVLQKIISDPAGFLKNLIAAVRGGLGNFLAHIGAHLQTGLAGWLFGTLGSAGIVLPEKLNLAGIFSLMAQILGVTWQAIRSQVVKRVGPMAEKVMDQVEKGIAWVGDLVTKGPIALMNMAQEFIGELQALFFNSFIEWIRNTVIVRAVEKLISMFNPAGAVIQAIIMIYNTIQFFVERAKQIAAFVNSLFNSIAEIAGGNIKKAVDAVEDSLVKALPVAISFLANLVGISGIVEKIKEIIQKIRKPIDKAVGKVVGFIVGKAKTLIGKIKDTGEAVVEGVKDKVGNFAEWWKARKGFISKNGEKHTLFFEGEGKNATLIVQSKPIAIAEFLKKARDKNNPKDKKYIENAEKIFSRIKILQEELPDKITGKRLNNDISNKEKQEQGFSELKQLLLDLADTLSYIQINDQNKEFPPVIYPPFINDVKASEETKVAFLNKVNGFAKGSKAGAHSGKLPGWNKIEEYELTNGRGGTFVKMHLIPESLGGYATDSNLTPGEAKLNSTLRDQVEQPAKEAIDGKQDMIWYEVRLTYNTKEKYQDFISSIKVQWGYYVTNEGGKWEKDTKVQKEVNQPVSPPVFNVEVININQETDSKKVRNALKISRTKAELIIEERIKKGIFKKVDDIFDRVEGLSSEQRNSINNSYVKRYFYF
ncbi:MAG TPA: hypothetical protein DDW50_02410 [Firmicutes bacterium]|jgi:hypothetical protein|nr:hypothetical protein [Bacillota bacterium]